MLLQQHSYRALTGDGLLKLVSMFKVPSSTISPLHRVRLPFQLSAVVSILKLLITATSNKCFSGQRNDNYCLKFTLTFILIRLYVILKFSNNCKGYAVLHGEMTVYNEPERMWKATFMVFFNVPSQHSHIRNERHH
jgi:hypothetical protein